LKCGKTIVNHTWPAVVAVAICQNTVEGHGKKCTFVNGHICSEFLKMVLVNFRQSYHDYCRYNFCSGKHQHIEKKTKSIPNPNGYLLLALANSVKNRLFQEKSKVYYQQKENIMCNYSTKNNEKSAKQFKKRALKINNW